MFLPFPLLAWQPVLRKRPEKCSRRCLRLHFGVCASSLHLWSFGKFSGAFPNECGWGGCKPHHWVHEETVYWYIIYNTEGTYSINQWIMSDEVFMKFYVAALLLMHRPTSPLDFLVHPNGAVFGSVYCFSLLCFWYLIS